MPTSSQPDATLADTATLQPDAAWTKGPLKGQILTWARLGLGLVAALIIAYLVDSMEAITEAARDNANAPRTEDNPAVIWRMVWGQGIALWAVAALAALGVMGRRGLVIWGLLSAAVIAVILWHWAGPLRGSDHDGQWLLLVPILFVAHELAHGIDNASSWAAPYRLYFEHAWKRGIHLALSLLFTGLFWAILLLGAAMLKVIGFDWLGDILAEPYFSIPLTGVAFAFAVNVGDVNPAMLGTVRAIVLNVLRWLAPIMVAIGAIFAVSLAFSGLQPLWDMDAATPTLLAAAIVLILLINAIYQDGAANRDDAHKANLVLDWSIRLGAILIVVFAGLALYSLSLRIGQYGLTEQRIVAFVSVCIALFHGLAYVFGVVVAPFLKPKPSFMASLEPSNIAIAYVVVAVVVALLTPLASPARLAAGDQMARLTAGKVSVDKFDFRYLRFKAGAYGKAALTRLAASDDKAIADKAKATLALDDSARWDSEANPPTPSPVKFEGVEVVYPRGASLPAAWRNMVLDSRFHYGRAPDAECATGGPAKACYMALADIDSDGKLEGIFFTEDEGDLRIIDEVDGALRLTNMNLYLDEADKDRMKKGEVTILPPTMARLQLGSQVHAFPLLRAQTGPSAPVPTIEISDE